MKQRMILCGVLVILIFAAHAPTLRATFVWDDTALVLRDPLIRSWRLIPEGFQRFLFVDDPVEFLSPRSTAELYAGILGVRLSSRALSFDQHPAPRRDRDRLVYFCAGVFEALSS